MPSKKNRQASLGARMAELRNDHRLRQQECADALGVAQPTYAEMESGEGRIRRRDLVTLSLLYGLTLGEAFPSFEDPIAALTVRKIEGAAA